jgi:hypothetical protein
LNKHTNKTRPTPALWISVTIENAFLITSKIYKVNIDTLDLSTASLYYEGSTNHPVNTMNNPGAQTVASGKGAIHSFAPYGGHALLLPYPYEHAARPDGLTIPPTMLLHYDTSTVEVDVTALVSPTEMYYTYCPRNMLPGALTAPTGHDYVYMYVGNGHRIKTHSRLDDLTAVLDTQPVVTKYTYTHPYGYKGACRLSLVPNSSHLVDYGGGFMWHKVVIDAFGSITHDLDLRDLPGLMANPAIAYRMNLEYAGGSAVRYLYDCNASTGFTYGDASVDGGSGSIWINVQADYSYTA